MKSTKTILPVAIDGGQQILAEVYVTGGEEEVASRTLSFDTATKAIETVAKQLTAVFDEVKPSKATVEFGITLSAHSGKLIALLVDGQANASLKISLQWDSAKSSPKVEA